MSGVFTICVRVNLLKGHSHDNFAAFSSNMCQIMTQNLCSKQEILRQPQEEDIKRFSKGEQTSVVFFLEIFPTHNDKT